MRNAFLKSPRIGSDVHREGPVARSIEQRTARLVPSDFFLWSALASIGASLTFKIFKKDGTANFIGQWAPTFLILGLYNKLVKLGGSDPQKGNPSGKDHAGRKPRFMHP